MEGVHAEGAQLRHTNLQKARITAASFTGADLSSAVFEYTGMGNCRLDMSKVNPLVHNDSAAIVAS